MRFDQDFERTLNKAEYKFLKTLANPARIQAFLDGFPYS